MKQFTHLFLWMTSADANVTVTANAQGLRTAERPREEKKLSLEISGALAACSAIEFVITDHDGIQKSMHLYI
uniref:Putative secreted protein n=1 Tax=Rhipicephalus microplus TaxID=6941 RepID=A0A6M2DEB9_RHIMP